MQTRARIADYCESLYRSGYRPDEIITILAVEFSLDEFQVEDWLPPIMASVEKLLDV